MALDSGGVRLTLSDPAPSFDPWQPPAADMVPERGDGAGLAMVRAWARIEGHAREGEHNVLMLPGAHPG